MYRIPPMAQHANHVYESFPWQEVVQMTVQNHTLNGRNVEIFGKELRHFGNASYLGFDTDERLKAAAIDAIHRYGVQFSSSRSFVQLSLYEKLEGLLEQIYHKPVVVTPSTTLAHLSAIPLFILPTDAVIMDYLAHSSMQTIIQGARGNGVHIEYLEHNDMDKLDSMVTELSEKYQKVWYFADGVYSMFGDMADSNGITELMKRHEKMHLYIDDAHGMSWLGKHGGGFVSQYLELNERIFLISSLNKGFGAGGGFIVCPNEQVKTWLKRCGPSLVFSGPLQPSALNAAIASAEIHLSPEIELRQQKLRENMVTFIKKAKEYNIPLADKSISPIFFIALGKQSVGVKLCSMVREAGFYTNLGIFPAVPMNKTGLRVSINWHLEPTDIDHLLRVVAELLPQVLLEQKSSIEKIEKVFGTARS